jgi:sarcosine oxidase subunit gamma
VGKLVAKSPLSGTVEHADLSLQTPDLGQVTSVAPFAGQADAVGKALNGLAFPAPNCFVANGTLRMVWTGRDQAFLIGVLPEGLAGIAALTDQSDGWVCLSLTGAAAADCLIRLIPLDLHAMQPGDAARAPLGHMQSVIMRVEAGFELLVFRSMAQTAWHEVETAMKALAARKAAGC